MNDILSWLNDNSGIASWFSGTITTIGLILTRVTIRNSNKVRLVFDVDKGSYRMIDKNRNVLRMNYIIKITNVGEVSIIPVEFGYVARKKLKKVYMPLITSKIDGVVRPLESMERGSQVALVEDILQNAGFTIEDKNIKVKAYITLNNGKKYYSDKTIVFNIKKLDNDGEKVGDMLIDGRLDPDVLLPNED